MNVKIQSALVSVYNKDGLEPLIVALNKAGVKLFSTGGTLKFIENLGIPCTSVDSVTGFPEILDGRVKTLHPNIFGGILARRDNPQDNQTLSQYSIPALDLVVVDLYPFVETVAAGGTEDEIIEKIDIGGISLIRAAAKNHKFTNIVSQRTQYASFLQMFEAGNGETTLEQRKMLASTAFEVSSNYDQQINNWMLGNKANVLRYGENPHQKGVFEGNLDAVFEKIQGKELSYNNLLDVDAALALLRDFDPKSGATFIIVKHNNACGIATKSTVELAWDTALACDSVSAFGGILAVNAEIDEATAIKIDKLFFEVLCAPSYSAEAEAILAKKTNRIILKTKPFQFKQNMVRTALNGVLIQDRDNALESKDDMKVVTKVAPTVEQLSDLEFAVKIVKHTKSNTIVLAKNNQLLASGTGQTSRVDALKQAIEKANSFGFDLAGAVMASDAFFPFPDCVEIADKSGITAVVQPGGSVRDNDSIKYCDDNGMAMVVTGVRHFKH